MPVLIEDAVYTAAKTELAEHHPKTTGVIDAIEGWLWRKLIWSPTRWQLTDHGPVRVRIVGDVWVFFSIESVSGDGLRMVLLDIWGHAADDAAEA